MNNNENISKVTELLNSYIKELTDEIILLENRLNDCNNEIDSKQDELAKFKIKMNISEDMFVPASLRSNNDEKYNYLLHEIELLSNKQKLLNDNIYFLKNRLTEYNFILSFIIDFSNNINDQKKIIDKIDFIYKLVDIDKNRAKEELFHVKQLFSCR